MVDKYTCITGQLLEINHNATVLSKSPETAVKIPYGKKYPISAGA